MSSTGIEHAVEAANDHDTHAPRSDFQTATEMSYRFQAAAANGGIVSGSGPSTSQASCPHCAGPISWWRIVSSPSWVTARCGRCGSTVQWYRERWIQVPSVILAILSMGLATAWAYDAIAAGPVHPVQLAAQLLLFMTPLALFKAYVSWHLARRQPKTVASDDVW